MGLDTKSLIIGAAVGYLVLPRVVGLIAGALTKPKEA